MKEWQRKIFCKVFKILADDAAMSPKQTARMIYKMMLEEGINPDTLNVDECLVKLNLAEKVYDATDDRVQIWYDD